MRLCHLLDFPMLALFILLLACGGDTEEPEGAESPSIIITTVTAPVPTRTIAEIQAGLSGFVFPIAGGCLPAGDQLMPNAARVYRQGVHEGVDFYEVDNCTPVTQGTPVVAAKDGQVIRADLAYQDVTEEELARNAVNPSSEEALDSFRGRQVWIDHGDGVVTRYAHLDSIASGIQPGRNVRAGEVIAFVGESGTPESLSAPGSEYHLHFEIRILDTFLGNGASPEEVRQLYARAFAR